jgi:uncharacterized membrane protein YeaQ/YmgE (transglycosylase-associated protein family)
MSEFAAIVLEPAGVASWIAVGLICAWLASVVMEAPSYGMGGDLFLGALGGFLGGVSAGIFVTGTPEWWISLLVALIAACLFIGIARALAAAKSA